VAVRSAVELFPIVSREFTMSTLVVSIDCTLCVKTLSSSANHVTQSLSRRNW